MTMTAPFWLQFLEKQYVDEFIPAGGSAFKVAVPADDSLRTELIEDLRRMGQDKGLAVVHIDAAVTKIHLMHEVFFRIAQAIPWERLAQQKILSYLASEGYIVDVQPDADQPLLQQIQAQIPDFDAFRTSIRPGLRSFLTENVFRNRRLLRDFRIAVFQMCLAETKNVASRDECYRLLHGWLTGAITQARAVRPYEICGKINRANARLFLESLCWWLHLAKHPGLMIVLDLTRLMRAAKGDGLNYTPAGVMDAYELLRQCIDGVDHFPGCFFVCVAQPSFLDEWNKRGIGRYSALKNRIFDDFQALTAAREELTDPFAALARLTSEVN
jgi:hypothetical protein